MANNNTNHRRKSKAPKTFTELDLSKFKDVVKQESETLFEKEEREREEKIEKLRQLKQQAIELRESLKKEWSKQKERELKNIEYQIREIKRQLPSQSRQNKPKQKQHQKPQRNKKDSK
jgi:hypothetical protein